MDPLATVGDLSAVNIDVSDGALVDQLLRVASATVRGAAGSPISRETSTIRYDGWPDQKYLRLAGPPVVSVSTVTVDGTAVTDWRLLADGRLRRACGWSLDCDPVDVLVTQVHGVDPVPEHIVDLVCSLVGAGIAAAKEGYAAHGGVVAERIDDYSVQYAQGAEAVASAMELPTRTRDWLASMFGGSAAMVTTRS